MLLKRFSDALQLWFRKREPVNDHSLTVFSPASLSLGRLGACERSVVAAGGRDDDGEKDRDTAIDRKVARQ